MHNDLLSQGVELMLYGMGTVVVFLALLVLVTAAMSRLVERWFPEPELTPTAAEALRRLHASQQRGGAAGAHPEEELVAVISAAIHRHRARRQ